MSHQEDGESQSPRKLPANSQQKAVLITDQWIEKYRSLYLEEYGQQIDKKQALDELTALVCFLNAVQKHNNKAYEQ